MIYLLRHGQTEFNLAGRYQGQVDSPLTPLGVAQAEGVAELLAKLVDPAEVVIMASPLLRAFRTAEIAAAGLGGLEVVAEPRLIEIGMGKWDGLTADELDARWPGVRDGFGRNEWFFAGPGGESYDQVAARLTSLLADVVLHPKPVRILVSHAISGRVLRGIFAGMEPRKAMRLEIPQDAIFRLHGDGEIERIGCD